MSTPPQPLPTATSTVEHVQADATLWADHPHRVPTRPTARFMWGHPARWLALGFGCGLSPVAPGTVATLWAWVAFLVLDRWLTAVGWAALLTAGFGAGWWACTRCARELGQSDPSAIVWDEILAFWLVLWILMPASGWAQAGAFVLFRAFDIAKPGPVAWADRTFKFSASGGITARQGMGILLDDVVAAGCTLCVLAIIVALLGTGGGS